MSQRHNGTPINAVSAPTGNCRGAEFRYTLWLPSSVTALSFVPSHHDHAIGERTGIRLDAQHLVGFPRG